MKVLLAMPAFCRAEMFVASRTYLEKIETPGLVDEKWIFLNKYPLPSVEENERKLIEAAERFGYKVFDSEYDRGLHKSFNNFLEKHPQPEGTISIGPDGDSAGCPGYDQAIIDVMKADPEIAICALWNPGGSLQNDNLKDYYKEVAGYRVCYHPGVEMFNVCGIDLDWIKVMGGFNQSKKYYGFIEIDLYQKLVANKRKLAYLVDFKEAADLKEDWTQYRDPEYREWKNAHLAGDDRSFGEWLKGAK